MSRFKVKTNRENMLKASYLRSIIREEIINQNRLYESTMGPLKLSYKNKLLFGDVSASAAYPGKDDNEIILKLPEKADGSFTLDTALSLGGRLLTADYFSSGSPFEKALRGASVSDESVRRSIAIAKIKNQRDLDQSRAFNQSQHFFVAVNTNNKSLKDAALVAKQQEERVSGPSFLELMKNDPVGGYGVFIDTLPTGEREKFISNLVKLNSALGVTSGLATMTAAAATGGAAAPMIAGVAGALAVGPSLALSSIAYNKGDKVEAAFYLASAVINTWFSASQMLQGVAAWREAKILISLKGSGRVIADKMADIRSLGTLKALLGDLKSKPKLMDEIKAAVRNARGAGRTAESLDLLSDRLDLLKVQADFVRMQDSLKSTLLGIFGLSADATGALIDAVIVLKTPDGGALSTSENEPEVAVETFSKIFAKIAPIVAEFEKKTGKSISNYTPEPGQSLLVNYATGTSRSIDALIIGQILDLEARTGGNLTNLSTADHVLAVPDYIFDTFDTLSSFRRSFTQTFSGTRSEKFYKDGKIIYMFDN